MQNAQRKVGTECKESHTVKEIKQIRKKDAYMHKHSRDRQKGCTCRMLWQVQGQIAERHAQTE